MFALVYLYRRVQRHTGEGHAHLVKRKTVYKHAKAQHPQRWNERATYHWDRIEAVHLNPKKGKSLQHTWAETA